MDTFTVYRLQETTSHLNLLELRSILHNLLQILDSFQNAESAKWKPFLTEKNLDVVILLDQSEDP